jgi:hypothetical protein
VAVVLAGVLVLAAVVTGVTWAARSGTSVVLVLLPHPDDEMQAWGVLDELAHDHVVLAYLTRGEGTNHCNPDLPGWQDGTGEERPDPIPQGPGSRECEEARIRSTIRFLEAMAPVTDWLPATLADQGTTGPLPDPEGATERCGRDGCRPGPGDVRVVTGDGITAFFFDLGDGDLTPGEAAWAARAALSDDLAPWLPARPRVTHVVGASFYNDPAQPDGSAACTTYPHVDHSAVTALLRDVDLGLAPRQHYPTCRTDPATAMTAPVDGDVWHTAFEVDGEQRIGHHVVIYGWLLTPYFAGDDATCPPTEPHCSGAQQELFHRYQTFGVRG